jgi:(5-formylfuran-3-yl)methyl phosphate synthase
MTNLEFSFAKPGLLVSVRNSAEALAALSGGADIIDVKEPNRGPLGAADSETISAVVRAVNGRATVTAALGELNDFIAEQTPARARPLPAGVSLFKIGLARCAAIPDWKAHWQQLIDSLDTVSDEPARPVAVVYADWRAAESPPPESVLRAGIEFRCPALLIDTWKKSNGMLFDHWPAAALNDFLDEARSHNLIVVLAGSLTDHCFATALSLTPDLIAVRGAACDAGRMGTVTADRVRDLKLAIRRIGTAATSRA